MGGNRRWGRLGPALPVAPGARVDRFEIFFDLVFVVSLFIITRTTAAKVTAPQLIYAALVLAVLWWCWVAHSVLATRVRLGEGFVPVIMVGAMAAFFAFAVALPQVFGDPRQGFAGPLMVAFSYVAVRTTHLALFLYTIRGKPYIRRRVLQLVSEIVTTTALLVVAALLPAHMADSGRAQQVRVGLWIAVIVFQYGIGLVIGARDWELISAEHWTERYELILIIALGESVISVGVGGQLLGKQVTWPAVLAAVLGILFTAALWWAHFDVIGPAARITLHAAKGRRRVTLARDAYAYLYLPMIAGIITFAIGAEELMGVITGPDGGASTPAPPGAVPLFYGGVMLYLAADMAFQLRALGTVTWTRVGVLLVLAGGLMVGQRLSALGALALLTVICVGLVTIEVVVLADARHALRKAVYEERISYEANEVAFRARWHEDDAGERPT